MEFENMLLHTDMFMCIAIYFYKSSQQQKHVWLSHTCKNRLLIFDAFITLLQGNTLLKQCL